MIRTGSVKLTQLSANGKEVMLWLNGPGDAVGMHADVAGNDHSCSARAMERCQVFAWDSQLLELLTSRYPQIQINLGIILARRLSELEERFREVASERVPKRMALVLIRLVESVGKRSRDGVDVVLRREDLAQMTGTTLFTISRILSKWAESGLIVPRREGIVIIDPDRLRQHAGLNEQPPADSLRQRGTHPMNVVAPRSRIYPPAAGGCLRAEAVCLPGPSCEASSMP